MSASMVPVVKVTECHQGIDAGPRQLSRIRKVRCRQGRLHSAHPTGTARRAAPLHRPPTRGAPASRPGERRRVGAGPASCRRASAPGGAGTRRRRSPAAARRRPRASGSGARCARSPACCVSAGVKARKSWRPTIGRGARVEHRPVERRRPVVGAQGPQRVAQRRRLHAVDVGAGAGAVPRVEARRRLGDVRHGHVGRQRVRQRPRRRGDRRAGCRPCSSRPGRRRARPRPCAPRRAAPTSPGRRGRAPPAAPPAPSAARAAPPSRGSRCRRRRGRAAGSRA